MKIRRLIAVLAFGALLSSCATPKVAYFSDMAPGTEEQILNRMDIKVQPDDKISILVKSRDPLLVDLFNLPIVSRQIGTSAYTSGQSMGISGYTVDQEGNIDFPVLGKVHVEGMTREEIATKIKNELINNDQVKDPVVTVEFMNLTVSVLGEVTKPGRFSIDRDKITLMDAISMAGDLTIFGKRDGVMVVREDGDKRILYKVDLSSAADLYTSPVFYLQQNDIVYVEPNSMRARQSTVNGNNVRSSSFWISLTSLLTTVITTILLIVSNTSSK
jgi:polysaccharide export outer membrane protein